MLDKKENRIIFLDFMRALAVLMMVQGHTIDVFLSDQYRDFAYPLFGLWSFIRGLTAPIFLFTAGAVFMYLFRSAGEPFSRNPRVAKGIKRFLLLVGVGYLLRYPTPSITDFTYVTEQSWQTFFGVDVLQLIGVSLLILLLAAFIAEKSGLSDLLIFSLGAPFFFGCHPLFERINWVSLLPAPLAGYLYSGSGSSFPLFPWTGYVLCGAVLGSYLAGSQARLKNYRLISALSLGGALAFALSWATKWLSGAFTDLTSVWMSSASLLLMRLGGLLLICAAVFFIPLKLNKAPSIIILIGRRSLPIYVLHLIILYGSAWNMGLSQVYERRFGVWESLGAAMLMSILMIGVIALWERGVSLFGMARPASQIAPSFQKGLDKTGAPR